MLSNMAVVNFTDILLLPYSYETVLSLIILPKDRYQILDSVNFINCCISDYNTWSFPRLEPKPPFLCLSSSPTSLFPCCSPGRGLVNRGTPGRTGARCFPTTQS